jgi:hypothetical protein
MMKKGIATSLLVVGTVFNSSAQKIEISTKIERTSIEYKGKIVKAKKLTVSSEIPMQIDSVWNNVKTSDLLIYVTKGYAKFKPKDGTFPKLWQEGDTVSTKTRVFGLLPFGGVRYLYFEKISDTEHVIQTREWDKRAKVWDHKIILEKSTNNKTLYTDEIVIYGGAMTGFITSFAKRFYKHRQKRWQIVAKENLIFSK